MGSDSRIRARGATYHALVLTVGMGVSQMFLAAVFVIAARLSSPADFGIAVVIVTTGTVAAAVLDCGITPYCVRGLASGILSVEDCARHLASKQVFVVLAAIVWMTLCAVEPSLHEYWPIGPVLVALSLSQVCLPVLRGLMMVNSVGLLILSEKVLVSAGFGLLLLAGVPPAQALVFGLIAGYGTNALGSFAFYPVSPLRRAKGFINPWSGTLNFSLFMTAISLQQADTILLSSVSGPVAAGQYGAVNRWIAPLGMFGRAFTSAALPFFAKSPGLAAAWSQVRRASLLLLLGVVTSLVIAIASPLFVNLLLGPQYSASARPLTLLACGMVVGLVNQPIAAYLMTTPAERLVGWATLCLVVLQLIGVALLAGTLGASSAAVMFLVFQVLLLAVMVLGAVRLRGVL